MASELTPTIPNWVESPTSIVPVLVTVPFLVYIPTAFVFPEAISIFPALVALPLFTYTPTPLAPIFNVVLESVEAPVAPWTYNEVILLIELVSIIPTGVAIEVAAGELVSPWIASKTLSLTPPVVVIVPKTADESNFESGLKAIPVAPFPNSRFPIFVIVTAFSPYIPVEFSPTFNVPVFPIFVSASFPAPVPLAYIPIESFPTVIFPALTADISLFIPLAKLVSLLLFSRYIPTDLSPLVTIFPLFITEVSPWFKALDPNSSPAKVPSEVFLHAVA